MAQNVLMKKAEAFCGRHKHRFTQPRADVLRIIAAADKPLGAYDILELLGQETDHRPKPPTVYRAIEFWEAQGFIHRIESMNAYVVCEAGHRHKGAQFMICDDCGTVTETHLCTLPAALADLAAAHHFTPQRWNLEIRGLCAQCQAA